MSDQAIYKIGKGSRSYKAAALVKSRGGWNVFGSSVLRLASMRVNNSLQREWWTLQVKQMTDRIPVGPVFFLTHVHGVITTCTV